MKVLSGCQFLKKELALNGNYCLYFFFNYAFYEKKIVAVTLLKCLF